MVQLLPALPATAVQVCTGTFVVVTVLQVVATQLLPAEAATGVQLETPVGRS